MIVDKFLSASVLCANSDSVFIYINRQNNKVRFLKICFKSTRNKNHGDFSNSDSNYQARFDVSVLN